MVLFKVLSTNKTKRSTWLHAAAPRSFNALLQLPLNSTHAHVHIHFKHAPAPRARHVVGGAIVYHNFRQVSRFSALRFSVFREVEASESIRYAGDT